jgi:hypothetical protein
MRLRRNLLLLPVACLVIAALAAQTPGDPDWQKAAGGKMAFDVGSVKPARPEAFILPNFVPDRGDWKPPGGRFRAILPLGWYIFVRLQTRSGPVRRNVCKASQMGEQLLPD